MKPNRGFAKDIYEILQAEGPLAYNGIHKRLRERNIRASSKQVKKALTNMQNRKQLQRTEHCKKKFVAVPALESNDLANMVMEWNEGGREAYIEARKANPSPTHPEATETPEESQISDIQHLLEEETSRLKKSIFVKATVLAGMLSVVTIVAAITASITINFLEYL